MKTIYIHIIVMFISASSFAPQLAELKAYTSKFSGFSVSFKMVPIPAGSFTMGCSLTEAGKAADEGTQKAIELSAFWMGDKEVTHDD